MRTIDDPRGAVDAIINATNDGDMHWVWAGTHWFGKELCGDVGSADLSDAACYLTIKLESWGRITLWKDYRETAPIIAFVTKRTARLPLEIMLCAVPINLRKALLAALEAAGSSK